MIIRSYLEWSLNASAHERAEAVGILATIYIDGELSPEDRRDAESALVLSLDDPSSLVRRMLAQILGGSERAPRPLISALSEDQPDIANIVIANSPLLTDAALVNLLALGESSTRNAIAQRQVVSPAVSAALVEIASVEAILLLIANDGAEIPLFSLNRLLERFPDDGELREALLSRGDLPVDIRVLLVKTATEHLSGFATSRGWLSETRAARLKQECAETGAMTLCSETPPDEMTAMVRTFRLTGQLTPQLLLRSVLSGDTRLLTAALADLASVSIEKASSFVHARSGFGFRALYRKAGMPQRLEPAFEAALSAWHEFGMAERASGRLSLQMVERVLTSLAVIDEPELDKLMVLLMRYQAEATREHARESMATLLGEFAPSIEGDTDDLEARLEQALQLEFQHAA